MPARKHSTKKSVKTHHKAIMHHLHALEKKVKVKKVHRRRRV